MSKGQRKLTLQSKSSLVHSRKYMKATAVVLQQPQRLSLDQLELTPAGDSDVVVDIDFSGISTGTERLLWSGRMPPFPGMGYPLVPGYESVGIIREAGSASGRQVGERVFVPGASCYGEVRGLFGGAASRVVVPGSRIVPIGEVADDRAVLLALAATAWHALERSPVNQSVHADARDLIVGHGVLGRLLARLLTSVCDTPPVVWEINAARRHGAEGYEVVDPAGDESRYRRIIDVSGDASLLDTLISRMLPQGEIVLAGFYSDALSFSFPPAFMREISLRVAAEWQRADLEAVIGFVHDGRLSLEGLITHRQPAQQAAAAYRSAFEDAECLKMVLDWRAMQ